MINLKRKTNTDTTPRDDYHARFQEAFFAAITEVTFGDELDASLSSIMAGIRRAFNADAFLFKRSGESASLVKSSAAKPDNIAALLLKAGIRLPADKIPLSGGRGKVFGLPFTEHDDLFDLLGDMTTSAACRKIQAELRFQWIASVSARVESADLAVVVLLPEKPATLKQDLDRFVFLLKAAYHLSIRKERLRVLETRFDEQFVKLKNDLREKESLHEAMFNEIAIPAAVLDERGVITESNLALKRLLGAEANPVGQSFSSLINEEGRRDFIGFFMGVDAGESVSTSLSISGRHYTAYILTRKNAGGQRDASVVFLADDTAGVELQAELGRTIDALRSDKESAEKLGSGARKYSEEIVRGSAVATLVVTGGLIRLWSGSAAGIFDVNEGERFDEFLLRNGLSTPSEDELVSEVSDSGGRIFSMARWRIADDVYVVFDDISEFRRIEEELRRSTAESVRLFNSFLPTAAVTGERISRWNDMFESLFKEFLSTDSSLDGFLRYLGESPEAFKSELVAGSPVMRTCRTTDRKYLNVGASVADDTIYLFLEDITEQENMKQQLRAAQGLLGSLLESFSEEPVFVVENGVARASNIAARQKLSVRVDERVDPAKILAGIGIVKSDDTGELNGQFYKVENTAIGSTQVYRFRLFNQEVAQRAEFDRLRRRQEILRNLSGADRFEGILQVLGDLLKSDGITGGKVVGTGTLYAARGTAEVYLMTTASGKVEPSLSLSVAESDTAAAKHGGALSGIEVPDTTFMNVISGGDSILLIQSTTVADSVGFASIAIPPTGVPPKYIDELGQILKAASSVAAGLHARVSAERKFEESGKVTRAIVGLTGMGEGSFEETSRRSIDLLRQVFGAESAGVYSIDGASMKTVISNGNLPEELSVPGTKFGALTPAGQLESQELNAPEGYYFAVKSRRQNIGLVFTFLSASPSPSELNAVVSVALDILESKRAAEEQSKISAQLVANSKAMSDFMMRLSKAATTDEVVKLLGDSLAAKMKDASVSIRSDEAPSSVGHPMEIVEKENAVAAVYEANFTNVALGVLVVTCSKDPLSRTMVELAVDKMRSIFAMKLQAVQSEAATLRSRLDRAREEYAALRESVEKIPASMRNARIGIDNVLSRLSFVQGDEKVIQEIRLYLASAAKEVSADLDNTSRNQDELFEAVRAAVVKPGLAGQDSAAAKVRGFETSPMTEFRVDQATFDLLKDLFSNFVAKSGVKECDVLMTTAQPGPGEIAEGKGKHIGIRVKAAGGEVLHGEGLRGSATMRTLAEKLEKLGYGLDANVLENEMMLDVYEIRAIETPGGNILSALLVEDDKQLVEEESQLLMQVFSRVKVAGDAVEAAKIFGAEKFSAAFVDLSLPSINGRDLCSQIKKTLPDCTTVLLTNREGEEKSEGIDHIALRPLDDSTIKSYMSKRV